jgi:hypothetical protein
MTKRLLIAVLTATVVLATAVTSAAAGDPFLAPPGNYLTVDSYDVRETPAAAVIELSSPPGNFSSLLWGYEAGAVSNLNAYDIGPTGAGPVAPVASCVPSGGTIPPISNGRGVAFDPLDGNLWISRLTGFLGDGLIHKITPPNVSPGICPEINVIPFGDGPGGVIQDDIGALDVDEATKHLWVAGYLPVLVGTVLQNYIYKVNRNNGEIINFCWTPPGPFPGNDTLTVFRSRDLPGSSKYLLTDAEEFTPTAPIRVIDQASCHDGLMAEVVATFPKTVGMTGIDFEWPGLLNTDGPFQQFRNHGDAPFATFTPMGVTGPPGLEDISLCGFRAEFGGDGNDKCPYTLP